MSKQQKKTLVPELRFPEFRDAGEWVRKPLCKIGDVLQGYGFPEKFQGKTQGDYPFYKVSDISNSILNGSHFIDKAVNYIDKDDLALIKAKTIPAGTTVFAKIGEAIRSNRRTLTTTECLIDNNVAGVKAIHGKANDLYIFYVLTQINLIEYSGGAVPSVNKTTLENIPVFSTQPEEQQKIADCLSSVDDLITAQAQKIDALKAHKKGLMQQLFPAEGETVPKLRFPEFQDAGEWEEDAFDELVEVIDGDRGNNYPKADEFSQTGYCVFLNAKNVTKNGFRFEVVQFITKEKDEVLRKGKLQRADVVLTTRGSVGQFAYYSEDVPYENLRINSGMVILRVKTKKINSDYLYTFSKSELLAAYIDNIAFGNAQQQLTVAEIKKFRLHYPEPEEQQKIADCLSNVDDLITAQSQKLDALKAHKKGLMQQLFPNQADE